MRVYRIAPQGLNSCCEKDLKNIEDVFQEAAIGEWFIVRVLDMTEEEYDALPEFMGF